MSHFSHPVGIYSVSRCERSSVGAPSSHLSAPRCQRERRRLHQILRKGDSLLEETERGDGEGRGEGRKTLVESVTRWLRETERGDTLRQAHRSAGVWGEMCGLRRKIGEDRISVVWSTISALFYFKCLCQSLVFLLSLFPAHLQFPLHSIYFFSSPHSSFLTRSINCSSPPRLLMAARVMLVPPLQLPVVFFHYFGLAVSPDF